MLRSDSVLEHEVAAELARDVICRLAAIRVAVKDGIVTLTGTVHDPVHKRAARHAVKRVFGVDGIDERLEIAVAPAQPATAVLI